MVTVKVHFPEQVVYWASNIIERLKNLKLVKDAYKDSFKCLKNNGSIWYAKAESLEVLKNLVNGEILNDVFTYHEGISVWDIPMPTFEVA